MGLFPSSPLDVTLSLSGLDLGLALGVLLLAGGGPGRGLLGPGGVLDTGTDELLGLAEHGVDLGVSACNA